MLNRFTGNAETRDGPIDEIAHSSSLRTSAWMNSPRAKRTQLGDERLAGLRLAPETTTRSPWRAKAIAAARPIPVSAPVIKTVWVVMMRLLDEGTEFHADDA